MTVKWRVFKERLPPSWNPRWVVWDDYGEHLFATGREALAFVNSAIDDRKRSDFLAERMRNIV